MINKTFEKFRTLETSKNNVSFDITTVLKDAVGSNDWQKKDGLWALISAGMTDFSSNVFERINNYAKNIMDVDTCQATALKSIAQMVNLSQITDFIKDIYPNFLNSLINTFSIDYKLLLKSPEMKFKVQNNTSISNLQFLNASKFLSVGAVAKFFGSIDQRNKYTFPVNKGYSQIYFLDILQNLDNIRYLLQTENNINFNQSAWSYIEQKNRLQSTSLDIKYLFLNDFHQTNSPSLNQIFKELQFYKNLSDEKIIQNKDQSIKIHSSQTEDQNKRKIEIRAIRDYYDIYIGQEISYLFKKSQILKRCTKINLAKDLAQYKNYYATFGISQTDHLQSILYYWTPYDKQIVNDITNNVKYLLINNYKFSEKTKIINPFLVLIAILKNIAYNAETQTLMKMSYKQQFTNIYIDLTNIILHAVETIQNDEISYYYSMILFHFYGILYDNIFNNYLKQQWNINQTATKTDVTFIGKYSEYTKEQFIDLVKNDLSSDQLSQFLTTGPTYYNQYHVDFIKSINILNSIISYGSDSTNNLDKLSYYIPYYNNDINPYRQQSYLYNNKFYKYKQKLLGIFYDYCNCNIPQPSDINQHVCKVCGKIIYDTNTSNNFTINIQKSYIYKAASIFADYCIKIKNIRETLKSLVQQYARIGTANLLNDIIGDYFYKQFSRRQTWVLQDNAAKTYDNLSAFNLFLDILDLTNKDTGNTFKISLQEYYDTTNYLNIYASSLISTLVDKYVDINVSSVTTGILTSIISSVPATTQITTYLSSVTDNNYTSTFISSTTDEKIYNNYTYNYYFNGVVQSYHYISSYFIDIPITTYTTGISYITSSCLSSCVTYIPDNLNTLLNANSQFWSNTFINNFSNLTQEQILDQCKFYQQYFPQLKTAYNDNAKITVFKTVIYPLLIKIWSMHAVSGFSGQLSDLSNYYSGISGKYKIENIVNKNYPTIAPLENIQNLFESQLINEYKSGYLFKNYYNELEAYASGIYVQLFQNTQNINLNVEPSSNYYFTRPMFGLPKNCKFDTNNNFHGYLSNYEAQYKSSNSILKIQADGPWKYTFLQKFIELTLTKITPTGKPGGIISSFISANYDYLMDETNYITFNNYVTPSTQWYPDNLHTMPYEIYKALLPNYKQYIQNTYSLADFDIENDIIKQANKLIIFTPAILRMQYYKIFDYKVDIFDNHYILFKHYKYNRYEDAGQIWIRYKNKPLSMPFMKAIKFKSQDNSYYNINQHEINIDLFLIEYDQVQCTHPVYTKIIKQMVNNAIAFNIYNDVCVIVGYTNFVKYNNNTFEKHNDYQYLKTVVFKIYMNDDVVMIDPTSIKFISTHDDNDYLLNINQYIGSYCDEETNNLNIVLYNINQNNLNINLYKQRNNYTDNSFLNNVTLTFLYVNYDINTYMLTYKQQVYSNVKTPIIGLYSDQFCVDIEAYKYYNSDFTPVVSGNMAQSVWKVDNTTDIFAISYESISNLMLEDKYANFLKAYDIIYSNTKSYVDVLNVKCELIYKNINNMYFPLLNKINISLDKDYLDDFKDYDKISSNFVEINAIYNSYPKAIVNDAKQLNVRLLPISLGGIKSFSQNITYDYTGQELMQKLIHTSNTDINGIKQIFKLPEDINRPDFKYGLAQLVYDFKNYGLLDRTNISATQQSLTQNDILSTIYSENYINNYNNDIGLTFDINLVNNYDPNLYRITNDFIRFLPNISNSILNDMKILVNFGDITRQVKQFLTGTETFDLDISVYIDDSNINGTQHFKKVGWNCGYTNTDYITWDSNDSRKNGPEVLTIHLKKYYNYLYKKYASNRIYNNPIFLEKQILQHTKDCRIVINVCWFNQSRIISINPNIQVIWNGIYYKKIINRSQMNFNIGCCQKSFQQVLHLDLVNNSFAFSEKKYYKVSTIYNTHTSNVLYKVEHGYYSQDKIYTNIIPANATIVTKTPQYVQTYLCKANNEIQRTWYIFNINKVINKNENIAVEDNDIIKYFKNCLTYMYPVSADMNISVLSDGSGVMSSIMKKDSYGNITSSHIQQPILYNENSTIYNYQYFSTDINYITNSSYIPNQTLSNYICWDYSSTITNRDIKEIDNNTSSVVENISGKMYIYPNRMKYLNYISVYNSYNSETIVTGSFNISNIYNQNYSSGYYFDNNDSQTSKYFMGNIFANKINISADFNWKDIKENIFINLLDENIVIPSLMLSSNFYKLDNKNSFYNQHISAGIMLKDYRYSELFYNDIGINNDNILTGNIYKNDILNNGNYVIILSPYYKVKQKIVFLPEFDYIFTYNYYNDLLEYKHTYAGGNKSISLNNNEFDIINTYFIGDQVSKDQILNGITPALIGLNNEIDYSTLNSSDIYYFNDTLNLLLNYNVDTNNIVNSNIQNRYYVQLLLYKYNTNISTLYVAGRLNCYNYYKQIYMSYLTNKNFIITPNIDKIQCDLDISITSSLINKYNNKINTQKDIEFCKYNPNNIISELSSNILYYFNN